jgi:deoxyribodipyrimidine photo-lyase
VSDAQHSRRARSGADSGGGTGIVWFRRDLRVHDHPPLQAALERNERVACVFVLERRLLEGRFPSPHRAWFLRECLSELRGALRERGGELLVLDGPAERALPRLAAELGATAVHFASDVSPFAMGRDRRVEAALREAGVEPVRSPGLFVADIGRPRTSAGRPYTVFSPFYRAWLELPRRAVLPAPDEVPGVSAHRIGRLDAIAGSAPAQPIAPGEAAARARLASWLRDGLAGYDSGGRQRLAGGTSELSPHLHFGTLSARELEQRVLDAGAGRGAQAFRRQLAWREFYAHVLLRFPHNARGAFKPAFDALQWPGDPDHLQAWRAGRTGYPVVDAGMRELAARGWMHNRARLICASFLTKDLHLDWRAGEAHFMQLLLCGDEAQNNGNWQWITSIGVDPQPYYRRIYNPMLQQQRYDPDGTYVRRWVPELRDVPLDKLAEPWTMTRDEQEAAGCRIGEDYPAPIVDHRTERQRALERYRAVTSED